MQATVSATKTVQERQYEPLTITVAITRDIDSMDEIQSMANEVEEEVAKRFEKRGLGRKVR